MSNSNENDLSAGGPPATPSNHGVFLTLPSAAKVSVSKSQSTTSDNGLLSVTSTTVTTSAATSGSASSSIVSSGQSTAVTIIVTSTPSESSAIASQSSAPEIESNSGWNQYQIAGVAVGAPIVTFLLGYIIYLLVRCHRRPTMSSHRDDWGEMPCESPMIKGSQSTTTASNVGGGNVSVSLGDPMNSSESFHNLKTSQAFTRIRNGITPARCSRPGSPTTNVVDSFAAGNHMRSAAVKGTINTDAIDVEQTDRRVLLTPRPPYFELDSTDTERANTAELPGAPFQPLLDQGHGPRSVSAPPSTHPHPLIPVAQSVKQNKAEHGQGRRGIITAAIETDQVRHVSPDRLERITATLNATPDDLRHNRHVNSWSHL